MICITGPECTGKTSLVNAIAERLKINKVDEYARQYLEMLGPKYSETDFIRMATAQEALIQLAYDADKDLILDTDLITYLVWGQEKGFELPEFIQNAAKTSAVSLYLLCKPDLPWEYDEQRENPDNRDELFDKYEEILKANKLKYKVVKGIGEERINLAVNFCIEHFVY